MNSYEREEQQIYDDFNEGLISSIEFNEQLKELQRDYRAAAEEACMDAYDNERSNW